MEEEKKEDRTLWTERFWEDPEKVMFLIDLLFLENERDAICS